MSYQVSPQGYGWSQIQHCRGDVRNLCLMRHLSCYLAAKAETRRRQSCQDGNK